MRKEPEIVRILREEERWRSIQKKNFDNGEKYQKKKDIIINKSSDDMIILKDDKKQISNLKPNVLEAIFKSIFQTSMLAILILNAQNHIISWNKYTETLFGITDKELYLKPIESFHPSNEWLKIESNFNNKLEFRNTIETKILTQKKELIDVVVSLNILKNEMSENFGSLYIIKNISEQKKIIEKEKKIQMILENSMSMIYQFNVKKGTYDFVSSSSVKILGYNSNELTSFSIQQIKGLIHPEDKIRWTEHLHKITQYKNRKNSVQLIDYRLKHKTLGYRWINDIYSAIFDEKNNLISIVGIIGDITERKKVWDQLVKSEEKYRILAETSADGVFTTDTLGCLTYVNPSFEKLCGRKKKQILTTPFRNYLFEDSIYLFQQIFIDVRKKDEKVSNIELELVSSDGNKIPIEINIAPLKKGGEFSGIVCTIRDITQRREIEGELKKNERLKTEFMNIAAHELRSPVTPIKGYLDLIIQDIESSQKIKNWAKICLRNADRLLKLITDILDVARLDSDTMRFDMKKLNLVELLNEIVEDIKPAITKKNLKFHVKIPSLLPDILGDKNRLSQVFKNLIDNSIKFTDCGCIILKIEKKNDHILIIIEDTGIGISKDELKKIFTKFYQAYTGEDRNNEGTGLGLFISKEIIKKHKGLIWVESVIGKGSRFFIQIPYIT